MRKIPILKLKNMLLISIQTDLHDKLTQELQQDVLTEISRTGAKGVLIDISSLDMVDSFMGRIFSDTAKMAKILDATVVITGIQPSVAITLTELGLDMEDLKTAINVDEGYELLKKLIKEDGYNFEYIDDQS